MGKPPNKEVKNTMQNESIQFTEKELKVIAMALSAQGYKAYGATDWFLDQKNRSDALCTAFDKVLNEMAKGGF